MKKIDFKTLVILIVIALIAIILRFWNLDGVPPSLDWDEASWGYNSYSLLQTGRDEYGKLLPIVIRSLNDYKPALYAYLTIPVIWTLGLTDFAVRFVNASFGALTVITTYFLAKELFKRRSIALVSSFLMAVSPWSIQFSRFAHEGTMGLAFALLMALFFLKGLKRPIFLSLAAVFGVLSLYSYQNEKIFIPLFAFILFISFYKKFLSISKKYIILAFIIGVALSLPLVIYTFTTPDAFNRAKGANFLNKPGGVLTNKDVNRIVKDKENNNLVGLVIDNRRVIYTKQILGNYFSHFDPNFLFIKGEIIPRHQPPGMGHLYLIELPFLLMGLYFLFFGKFSRQSKIFIGLWMFIVPLSASITWDVPNSGRTLSFLPTFQMITAIGLVSFYELIKKRKINKLFQYLIFSSIGFLFLINFVYFLNQYFVQYKYFDSQAWQYGYNQIIPEIKKEYPNYERIIVSTKVPLDQSYIFFLYNLKFPPKNYHVSLGNKNFDKYEFREIISSDIQSGNLYVGSEDEFTSEQKQNILKRIYFLDGSSEIIIVKG